MSDDETLENEEEKAVEEENEFDLSYAEWPFKLCDKTDGTQKEYVLREMDGTLRDQYVTLVVNRVNTAQNGKRDMTGMYAELLARCIWSQPEDKRVSLKEIQTWPATFQKKLFNKARKLNGLDDDEEATKND